MSGDPWITVVGAVAAVCTTVAFVPQIVRIRRQGGRDLSYGMLLLYLAGVLLWLGYGLLIGARAVILANVAATLLVSLTLVLKWLSGRSSTKSTAAGPSRRVRIAIDMDEVIADSFGKHLRIYNQTFGQSLTRSDVIGCSLSASVPSSQSEATRQIVRAPGFFADLDEIDGGREVVRQLAERYEVFIASAAMEVPNSFADKYAWLQERFPFIDPSHIVFCGDKAILDVDYLIDDTARHFDRFRGTPILFDAPHNRSETRFHRVEGWDEVAKMFLTTPLPEGRPALATKPELPEALLDMP
jgi:5'-nucleotidase